MQAIEIEVDGPFNEALQFAPIQRSVRGRFDLMRMGEPYARIQAQQWPIIPSQRLGIDPDGNGYLFEPLHEPEHAAVRDKITKLGMRLEDRVQQFPSIHLPSWLFWIKQAVQSGIARVTKGQLPDVIDGEPRKNFILAEPEATSSDKLTAALTEQTAAFNRLADVLTQFMAKK